MSLFTVTLRSTDVKYIVTYELLPYSCSISISSAIPASGSPVVSASIKSQELLAIMKALEQIIQTEKENMNK